MIITPSQINFSSYSFPVKPETTKFVISVPQFQDGGEPLIIPSGFLGEGGPIKDWQGNPKLGKGIVFINGTDSTAQGALGDGNSVIIINQVDMEKAKLISDKIQEVSGLRPSSLEEFKNILDYIKTLGLGDMYNSNKQYVDKNFLPQAVHFSEDSSSGLSYGQYKTLCKECEAVYIKIPGEHSFQGPAGSPQKFKDNIVVVKGDKSMHAVQTSVFLETYKTAGGQSISLQDLEVYIAISENIVSHIDYIEDRSLEEMIAETNNDKTLILSQEDGLEVIGDGGSG